MVATLLCVTLAIEGVKQQSCPLTRSTNDVGIPCSVDTKVHVVHDRLLLLCTHKTCIVKDLTLTAGQQGEAFARAADDMTCSEVANM